MSAESNEINTLARGVLPNGIADGTAAKTNDNARRLHTALNETWGLPTRITRDGTLVDISKAMRLARDADAVADVYGHAHPFLAASLAGDTYQRGQDANVDAVIERGATPDGERAGPIDAGTVQSAVPIQVDPVYVDIQPSAAPMLDLVQFEAQSGFTAQYNTIDQRSPPIGNVDESNSLDLSNNDKGDFGTGTKTRDMGIYVDQVELSDFTQRATETLGSGSLDVEDTALGQRMKVHQRFTAGELVYGDPINGITDGSIQDETGTPGLARICEDADTGNIGDADNVIDKSGVTSNLLEDIKTEITKLVTNTGANYDDLVAVCSPTFFDAIENSANTVVRLGGYDEDINFGGRGITIKNNVPLREVRAVGRGEHGQLSYQGTGGSGNFDPDAGDVFIFSQRAFRRRQLSPLSPVPLGRVGLADKAAMFEFKANIDKAHGAHNKYLQSYDS